MSLHTSSNKRACVMPRHVTRPYRMHPGRREHIYGRVQPMDSERTNTLSWFILGMFVALFITPLIMGAA